MYQGDGEIDTFRLLKGDLFCEIQPLTNITNRKQLNREMFPSR